MRNRLLSLVVCALLAIVVVGCGGDDEGDNEGGNERAATTKQEQTTGTSGGAAAESVAVEMKDISFQPETVSVAKGGTVTWTNEDSVGHDVTAEDDSFKSGDPGGIAGGGSYKHAFDQAGTISYICTVHPGMEGTVQVK